MDATTTKNKLVITPLPAFSDNYIWILHNHTSCVVVDPGDADVVFDFLKENKLRLETILVTHHHPDHTGGINKLVQQYPYTSVFGPKDSSIPHITQKVVENHKVFLNEIEMIFNVKELPGHTLDHIMYEGHGVIFSGDVLFSAGCGRVFEGTYEQMLRSIDTFFNYPDNTLIYCTHEYTLANIEFALTVEPNNETLKQFKAWALRQRSNNFPTLPTNISEQKKVNPFMRLDSPEVIAFCEKQSGQKDLDRIELFTILRKAKDNF
ncbi:hydroxyacylglutathione hydrolase [Opacimonas viscosa]|uniref:Hydroxyacylglutathione hydrolase n=1 Tax=Opacimonas viscosa TaxID=2961944 RepID=A0AA41X152_9ALTE|nr:hydroxyacylglutathione hydrolase [Opacimonas viscosa]MCP3428058.1 hydroxyacylglutathione hydrolase [Opacimonas viscosa]